MHLMGFLALWLPFRLSQWESLSGHSEGAGRDEEVLIPPMPSFLKAVLGGTASLYE